MNDSTRKLRRLTIILLACSVSLVAQDRPAVENSLQAGAWALQFGITSNLTLTSFQGSMLGVVYRFSADNALRGGIGFNANINDGTNTSGGTANDTSFGSSSGSSSSNYSNYSLILQYVWYIHPENDIHLYYGIGPLLSYYRDSYSNANPRPLTAITNGSSQGFWETYYSSTSTTRTGAGVGGVIGVEWNAYRWVTVHADYDPSIQYLWGKTSDDRRYTFSSIPPGISLVPSSTSSSGTTTGWNLTNPRVYFGIDVIL